MRPGWYPGLAWALIGMGAALLLHDVLEALSVLSISLPTLLWSLAHPRAARLKRTVERPTVRERPSGKSHSRVSFEQLLPILSRSSLWLMLAGLAALLAFDPLKSTALAVVVGLIGVNLTTVFSSQRRNSITRDARELIYQFSQRYPMQRSVSLTLQATLEALRPGEVRSAVEAAVRDLSLGMPAAQAFAGLKAVPDRALAQLADLLGYAQQIDSGVFASILAGLEKQVHAEEVLARKGRQELTLLTATQRVLQVVLAVGLIVAAFGPLWRDYFLTGGNWATFVGMGVLAMAGSYYVQSEVTSLEESL